MSAGHAATGPEAGGVRPGGGPAPRIGMIWAQTAGGVIGAAGGMPWRLPEDMAHFVRTTTGHPVIMGRRTWESIPARFRPFAGRTNIVLTSHAATAAEVREAGALAVGTLGEALEAARAAEGSEEIWIVGGGEIYAAYAPRADTAVVTVINLEADGDTRAPLLGDGWSRTLLDPDAGWLVSANGLEYRHELWERTT